MKKNATTYNRGREKTIILRVFQRVTRTKKRTTRLGRDKNSHTTRVETDHTLHSQSRSQREGDIGTTLARLRIAEQLTVDWPIDRRVSHTHTHTHSAHVPPGACSIGERADR